MKYTNILSHEDRPELVNLPGGWPGVITGNTRVIRQFDGTEFFLSKFDKSDFKIQHVMLAGKNNYACSGVRYCLQQIDNIRLKQYSEFSSIDCWAAESRADAIILIPENESEEQSVFIFVMTKQYYLSETKIMIVGKEMGMLNQLMSKYSSCIFLDSKATTDEFYRTTAFLLSAPACKAPRLSEILTPQQWRTLCIISNGQTLNDAARKMGISPKTAYTHKVRAFTRLGIESRLHEAWIMEVIKRVS